MRQSRTCRESVRNYINRGRNFSILDIDIKKEFIDTIISRFTIEWNSKRTGENFIFGPNLLLLRRLIKKYYPNSIKPLMFKRKNDIYNFYIDDGIYYVPLDYTTFCRIIINNDADMDNGSVYVINIIGLRAKFWYAKIRKLYNNFFKYIDENDDDNNRIQVKIYDETDDDYFSIPHRGLDKYYFDDKEVLISMIENWKKCKSIFEDFNQKYRFSVMLYGIPGTGKTSFAYALAKSLKYDLLKFNSLRIFLKRYNSAHIHDSIILLDEIDIMIRDTNMTICKEEASSGDYTFLQAIDGLDYGNILICTTNHLEYLPENFFRPGRFNIVMEVKPATEKNGKTNARCIPTTIFYIGRNWYLQRYW